MQLSYYSVFIKPSPVGFFCNFAIRYLTKTSPMGEEVLTLTFLWTISGLGERTGVLLILLLAILLIVGLIIKIIASKYQILMVGLILDRLSIIELKRITYLNLLLYYIRGV